VEWIALMLSAPTSAHTTGNATTMEPASVTMDSLAMTAPSQHARAVALEMVLATGTPASATPVLLVKTVPSRNAPTIAPELVRAGMANATAPLDTEALIALSSLVQMIAPTMVIA